MSEGPRDYDLNFDAANELEAQVERGRAILARLAAHLAANQPQRNPDFKDLVEREHVRQAAEFLYGSESSIAKRAKPAPHCIFISYSHEDDAFVSELAEKLTGAGLTFFLSERDLKPPCDWAESIWEAIRVCRLFLPVLTPRFVESRWSSLEGGAACASKKKVLPVLRYVDPGKIGAPFDQLEAVVVENGTQLDDLIERLRAICRNDGA